ncbi:MAG: hypothetical protein RIG68_02585 [Imperialibacter sp.]|uniref:nucleotidyl transferase AbiEii/AbiGii toxin family protein n=1 Tax=Imperialibacter sp. TaxID=2038411 RepID=UPI0032EBD805
MKNTQINRIATSQVAQALGDLNEQVIYVGGAVVSLYVDDPAADDVRPTKDVDITFEIVTIGQLELLREALFERGFTQSHEDKVVCRFRLEDKKVDVMSTHEVGWAPANRWFKRGFELAFVVQVEQFPIRLMPLPYFLAAKFDAFKDRGRMDPRMSHDFEDIVYLLNYTSDFPRQILDSERKVKDYLGKCFEEIISITRMQEAIIGNLYYEDQEVRYEHIVHLMKQTIDGI